MGRAGQYVLCSIICFVLTAVVLGHYFPELMYSPGTWSPTLGGDGLTIHYNLQYHATYGEGTHLTSQYYPHGESIFMTDAQAMLAIILAKLRAVYPDLHYDSVKISNIITLWSTPLSAVVLFFCMMKLKMRKTLAVLFSVLIALLSPQIIRQLCGHYGLGFSFLLPLVMYFMLHEKITLRFFLLNLFLILILVFLGLNNPYLLAISCSWLLAAGGVGVLITIVARTGKWKLPAVWMMTAIASLLIVFSVLHAHDHVEDRVEVPFGFFANKSTIKGYLFPDHGWTGDLQKKVLPDMVNNAEGLTYLGVIPILVFIGLLFLLLFRRKDLLFRVLGKNQLALVFIGSLFVLAYSFGLPFRINQQWSLDNLGKVLQFRAPARFGWVFYYTLSLVSAVFVDRAFRSLWNLKGGKIAYPFLGSIFLLWSIDVHQFMTGEYNAYQSHTGFTKAKLKFYNELSQKHQLDRDNFHGIFLLPTEHGWTDKVFHNGSWRSNYEGYKLSLASGLPLINGKLSRMSVSHTLDAMQIVSDPAIKKEYLQTLSKDKKILFLNSKENELKPSEEYLINISSKLFENEKFAIHEIMLDHFLEQNRSYRARVGNSVQPDSVHNYIAYEHFDGEGPSFDCNGYKEVDRGRQPIAEFVLSELDSERIEVSFWNLVESKYQGGPWYILQFLKDENLVSEHKEWALDQINTQNGWLRVSIESEVPSEANTLRLFSNYDQRSIIDEMLIRKTQDSIVYKCKNRLFVNNYLIK